MSATLTVAPPEPASANLARVTVPRPGTPRFRTLLSERGSAVDVIRLTRAAPGTVACPLPTTLGSTINVYTTRTADGKLPPFMDVSGPTEPWQLVGISSRLAVFFDSSTVRVAAKDDRYASLVREVLARYDSEVAPFSIAQPAGFLMPTAMGMSSRSSAMPHPTVRLATPSPA